MKLGFLECLRKALNLKYKPLIGSYYQPITGIKLKTKISRLSVIVSQKSEIIPVKQPAFLPLNTRAHQPHQQKIIRHVSKKKFRNLM